MDETTSRLLSIQDVARLTGTTSRTLRHYQAVGLLEPTTIGSNGYRWYGGDALVRLQRILLLRDLGLGLPAIAEVLARRGDATAALRLHRSDLEQEKNRLARQIASIERTIAAIENGEDPMTTDMFDGFDHTRYEEEVTERWGADAYRSSDTWWRGMTAEDKAEWTEASRALAGDWIDAAARGLDPTGVEVQALAACHVAWLAGIPGTPGSDGAPVKEYVTGLGEMYVADERFAAVYGGEAGATFVRDALIAYADARL
jgi:DNA-binding transcriptional MerR regulator